MVDAGKIFLDIALEDVTTGTGKLGKPVQGPMGAVSLAVGIGIIDTDILRVLVALDTKLYFYCAMQRVGYLEVIMY
ncbi:MAG: hypothetical protein EBE86_028175 [Hormoscilla sp. GUM202]|nr:hypothetical protein [Hormoscilla sp. GUM202]